MSRNTTHRSSETEYNGKALFTVFAGLVAANATTRFARFVAPCDCTIREALLGIIVSPTNAASVLRIGLDTDTDSHLDDKNIQNATVGTTIDLLSDALFVLKTFNRGDRVVIEFTDADTTGELALTLLMEPR